MSAQCKLFDITANRHGGNERSNEAKERSESSAEIDRRRILAAIQAEGVNGLCCDEIEQILNLSHQSCSARCSELKKKGKVRARGYRLTRTGSKADVLVAVGARQKLEYWKEK